MTIISTRTHKLNKREQQASVIMGVLEDAIESDFPIDTWDLTEEIIEHLSEIAHEHSDHSAGDANSSPLKPRVRVPARQIV